MPVTKEAARKDLDREDIAVVSDVQLTTTLANVDQAAELATERARWTTQVWDRTSPINGVPAAHFLARDDVSESPCYLLLCDGEVVYFQPHQPGVAGHKAIVDTQATAKGHADRIAGERADAATLAKVRAEARKVAT